MSQTDTRKKKAVPAVAAGSKGRPEIDPEMCKGCELCLAACPEGALKLSTLANSQGALYAEYNVEKKCTACKTCAIVCPETAITIYKFEAGE